MANSDLRGENATKDAQTVRWAEVKPRRRLRPPPAYCVRPGFFINRSTEEGRADREVVLQEGRREGFQREIHSTNT